MQIVSVLEDDFTINLSAKEISKKKRKFKIKEIRNDDKDTINDASLMIDRRKSSTQCNIDIGEDHDNTYHLVLCDAKNTDDLIPNVNELKFTVIKDESEYPPTNTEYKPNPIDVSTLIASKNETRSDITYVHSFHPLRLDSLAPNRKSRVPRSAFHRRCRLSYLLKI